MSTAAALRGIVEEAGYVAIVDGDFVHFKSEGTPFSFEAFPDDVAYARLILAFGVPDGIGMDRLLAVANERNGALKAVKTAVHDAHERHVAFTIEMIGAEPGVWGEHFERLLRALRDASDTYFELLTAPETANHAARGGETRA